MWAGAALSECGQKADCEYRERLYWQMVHFIRLHYIRYNTPMGLINFSKAGFIVSKHGSSVPTPKGRHPPIRNDILVPKYTRRHLPKHPRRHRHPASTLESTSGYQNWPSSNDLESMTTGTYGLLIMTTTSCQWPPPYRRPLPSYLATDHWLTSRTGPSILAMISYHKNIC